MNDRVFVDTNVFLYAKDHRFREKQDRARVWLSALTARDSIVISQQVLGEMGNSVLRGRLPIAPEDVRRDTLALETLVARCNGFGAHLGGLDHPGRDRLPMVGLRPARIRDPGSVPLPADRGYAARPHGSRHHHHQPVPDWS